MKSIVWADSLFQYALIFKMKTTKTSYESLPAPFDELMPPDPEIRTTDF